MKNNLPMAIASSIDVNTCNFVQIQIDNHLILDDFLIETNHKLIESKIALFLGLDEMEVQETAQTIILDKYIYGRGNCIKALTLEQVQYLFRIANNPRADKYKPLLLEAMFTQIMPLFNGSVTIAEPIVEAKTQTMSSLEIAELTGKAHYNIIRDIENLINELGDELKIEGIFYTDKMNRQKKAYSLDREATLLLTSGYSAQLRLKIIRRLDELENRTAPVTQTTELVVPQNLPEALRLAATLAEEKETLVHERDEAIRTKAHISDKKTASALSKAGYLARKVKQLEMKLEESQLSPSFEYATVLAIQRRVKIIKFNGLRLTYYCNKHGLVMKEVEDDRYGTVHSYPAQAWRDVYQIDIYNVLNRLD